MALRNAFEEVSTEATLAALNAKVPEPESGRVPVAPTGDPVPYWPSYGAPERTGPQTLKIDPGGALLTRAAVLTDEGTFRVNFANASTALGIGSVAVSGNVVTGTGFATADVHYRDYFKLAADADTAWMQIDSIDSDTQITLVSNYVGASSGTGQRSLVLPYAGTGGSFSVASGALTLTSGATNSAITGVKRFTDYGPLVFRAAASVSQRIANQDIHIGLEEDAATTRWFARFVLDGTTNTTAKCETGRNPSGAPSASETQTTTITLPFGATTAASLEYRVELLTESVRFYVSGVLVAQHTRVIPSQADEMISHVEVRNGTGATSTNVVVDYLTGKNHNKLEIGVMSDAEQIIAAAAPLQQFSYSVAGVIAINTDLIVLDCSQLRSLFIQCTSMGTTGVVTVQWSNDAAFTAPITATLLSEAGATSTTFNAAVMRVTNVMARYCRIRLTTATTAGTTTINAWGSQSPYMPIVTTQPISGSVSVSGTVTSNIGTGTLAAVTAAGLAIPGTIADVASAAIISTATTAALTPTFGTTYQVNIPVTAVTGTTPTMDVGIEESDDAGTNWFRVYDFPRITATGIYRSPKLPLTGNRVRYVQTIAGTTPSFTRAINRLQNSDNVEPVRQRIDRSLASTQALNAVIPSLNVENCRSVQILITAGVITTTAPALQLEGSDDNGLTWYAIGAPLTAVASSTVRAVTVDVNSQLIRARVSTAGSGATLTHVLIKGF